MALKFRIPPRRLLSFRAVMAAAAGCALTGTLPAAEPEPARPAAPTIAIARPTRPGPVDFLKDVLPILQANCLPCHNKTTTKGDLLLESPADMLKGGESGPVVVPGKASESMLIKVSTHQIKPRMPPKENKVNAKALTPAELGWIAQWIDEGAKASEKREELIAWKPLPDHLVSILAVAASSESGYAACGRGGRIHVYHLPTGTLVDALDDSPSPAADPAVRVAHRDQVNALAISPDGTRIASGGYRELKIWKRTPAASPQAAPGTRSKASSEFPVKNIAAHASLKLTTNGLGMLVTSSNSSIALLHHDGAAWRRIGKARRSQELATAELTVWKSAAEAAAKEVQAQRDRLKKAREGYAAAAKALADKEKAAETARIARHGKDSQVRQLQRLGLEAAELEKRAKPAKDQLAEAEKALEKAESELTAARLKESTTRNEVDLAVSGAGRAELDLVAAQWEQSHAQKRVTDADRNATAAEALNDSLTNRLVSAAFSPDGRWLATAHSDRTVRTWLTVSAEPLETYALNADISEFDIDDSGTLTILPKGGSAIVHSPAAHWTLERTLGSGDAKSLFPDRVTALAFRPDGLRLAVGSGEPSRGGELRIFDVTDGREIASWPQLHSDVVLAAAYSPDGLLIATGGADRFARIVDPGAVRLLRSLEGHTGHVLSVAWAPHGRLLVTGGGDYSVKWWETATGTRRKQASGFTKEIGAVGYFGNTSVAAVSGDPFVRLLNENAETLLNLDGVKDFQNAAAISPDGRWLVAGGHDGILRVWTENATTPVAVLPAPDRRPQTASSR